jgi:hypothetical protein
VIFPAGWAVAVRGKYSGDRGMTDYNLLGRGGQGRIVALRKDQRIEIIINLGVAI